MNTTTFPQLVTSFRVALKLHANNQMTIKFVPLTPTSITSAAKHLADQIHHMVKTDHMEWLAGQLSRNSNRASVNLLVFGKEGSSAVKVKVKAPTDTANSQGHITPALTAALIVKEHLECTPFPRILAAEGELFGE